MPNTGKTLVLQVRMPAFLVTEALEKDTHVSPLPLPAVLCTLGLPCPAGNPRLTSNLCLSFPKRSNNPGLQTVEQRPFRGQSEFEMLPKSDCSSSCSIVRFFFFFSTTHYPLYLLSCSQAVNAYGDFLQIKKYIASIQIAQMWPLCAPIRERPSFLLVCRALTRIPPPASTRER